MTIATVGRRTATSSPPTTRTRMQVRAEAPPVQVEDLFRMTVEANVPVMAYGRRTDFRTEPLPGAERLPAPAHSIEENTTICRCGSKAMSDARFVDGTITVEGPQVVVDGANTREAYEALCGPAASPR